MKKKQICLKLAQELAARLGGNLSALKFAIQRAFTLFCEGQGNVCMAGALFKPRIISIGEALEYRMVGKIGVNILSRASFVNFQELDRNDVWGRVSLQQYLCQAGLVHDSAETDAIESYLISVCKLQ